MSRRFVLDSSAVLSFLQDQPGSDTVEDLIRADDTELAMSLINLGEVRYVVHRVAGEARAAQVEEGLLATSKIKMFEASWERIRAAARIKAAGGVSLADCFGIALAEELGAALVTSDAEVRRVEVERSLSVLWLT